MTLYDDAFYADNRSGSRRSAAAAVPIVLEYVRPQSVLDVGCGLGTWLAEFATRGAGEIVGVDGDWVLGKGLDIPSKCFVKADLGSPLDLGRKFDLTVSLEVAEHLPEMAAETFVENLVRHAPLVLFSAAVPFQGGTGHLNEQWPEWWAELFDARGYRPVDCLRGRIWTNPDVEWWYAQNMLFFGESGYVESHPRLREAAATSGRRLSLVHPKKYLLMAQRLQGSPGASPPLPASGTGRSVHSAAFR